MYVDANFFVKIAQTGLNLLINNLDKKFYCKMVLCILRSQ